MGLHSNHKKPPVPEATPAQPSRTLADLKIDRIQVMGRAELLPVREALGLGGNWNVAQVPIEWLPPGGAQTLARMPIRARLEPHASSRADLELAVLHANRFLLLCFVAAESTVRGARLLSVTTVMRSLEQFIDLLRCALQRPAQAPQRLLDRLVVADLQQAARRTQAARIARYVALGLWSDGLASQTDFSLERSRRGKARALPAEEQPKPYLPLPDEFVAQAGWRLAWITRTLGPCMLAFAAGAAERFQTQERLVREWRHLPHTRRQHAKRPVAAGSAINNYVAEIRWTTPDGAAIEHAPEALLLPDGSCVVEWPPRTYSHVKLLLHILQFGHLFIFLLSSGGRISETLSLHDGCVVESADGIYTANGRTYKLVFDHEGATRDWPLPELAVHAIRQQEELARSLNVIGRMDMAHAGKKRGPASPSIWKSVGRQGAGFKGSYNHALRRAIQVLGLDRWLDGESLSAHRFRKTIARLIALAVVDAPKILMDLFGHKAIEMTLHYILTDPTLRSEMAEVAKAQVILRAKDAIGHADDLGGPAAAGVQRAMDDDRRRIGREFGEEDLKRLAETFTFSGRYWQLVRPGVLCTKGPHQAGPCNKSVGAPEPARCRSECSHRLEESFLREDTDQAIAEAVRHLETALQDQDEIGAEMWRGQILTHLPRFPDLATKWREHALVAGIAAGAS